MFINAIRRAYNTEEQELTVDRVLMDAGEKDILILRAHSSTLFFVHRTLLYNIEQQKEKGLITFLLNQSLGSKWGFCGAEIVNKDDDLKAAYLHTRAAGIDNVYPYRVASGGVWGGGLMDIPLILGGSQVRGKYHVELLAFDVQKLETGA